MKILISNIEIGLRIKLFRRDAELSQEKLAELVGVTPQQIQKYEAGKTRISIERIQIIAHALGKRVSAFFSHDHDGTPVLSKAEEAIIRKLRKAGDRRINEGLAVILDILTTR